MNNPRRFSPHLLLLQIDLMLSLPCHTPSWTVLSFPCSPVPLSLSPLGILRARPLDPMSRRGRQRSHWTCQSLFVVASVLGTFYAPTHSHCALLPCLPLPQADDLFLAKTASERAFSGEVFWTMYESTLNNWVRSLGPVSKGPVPLLRHITLYKEGWLMRHREAERGGDSGPTGQVEKAGAAQDGGATLPPVKQGEAEGEGGPGIGKREETKEGGPVPDLAKGTESSGNAEGESKAGAGEGGSGTDVQSGTPEEGGAVAAERKEAADTEVAVGGSSALVSPAPAPTKSKSALEPSASVPGFDECWCQLCSDALLLYTKLRSPNSGVRPVLVLTLAGTLRHLASLQSSLPPFFCSAYLPSLALSSLILSASLVFWILVFVCAQAAGTSRQYLHPPASTVLSRTVSSY